jgi:hypothetical protein
MGRRIAALRLADEQMEVFGHYNVGDYVEDIATANLFKDRKKEIACLRRSQRPAGGPPVSLNS